MKMNITQKILTDHLIEGELVAGREIAIRIDQTLTQDATGTMAFLQFESMGLDRVRNELALSYVDHNTIQVGPENADDHEYLRTAAARYGAVFSMPGNGICHQLHLERFGAPGKTLLGADSHTPTGGGLGMLAIGAGGLDVAVAMGGGAFHLAAPRVCLVRLEGKLPEWVSAKDVILKVLQTLSTRGNVGVVLEYGGRGVAALDVPERATITNMGAECGVTTSVFPSDAVTKRFLEAQGRGGVWRELLADEGAGYDKVLEIDLSKLEPLAAAPHSPGNVVSVSSIAGTKVHQVCIGSCTNSSYRDLATVARVLEGRHVAPGVSLGLAPGSRQVLQMLAFSGGLGALLGAGARLYENACGFCIGNSASPGTNGVSVRTSNRNFEGRSGTPSAKVYLTSPETAAVAALKGEFADPRGCGLPYPAVKTPSEFDVDDTMFVFPPADGRGVAVRRGPNIGTVPGGEPLPAALEGEVAIKVGDRITTDHIMPAGQRLKYRSNIEKYSTFVFEGVDAGFAARAAANKAKGVHNVIVAGDSYGQGSSREHAAMCPMHLGVKAVVARSIERIHKANLINFGIVPFTFENGDDCSRVEAGAAVRIDGLREAVKTGKAVMEAEGGPSIHLRVELSAREADILLAGGLLRSIASGVK